MQKNICRCGVPEFHLESWGIQIPNVFSLDKEQIGFTVITIRLAYL